MARKERARSPNVAPLAKKTVSTKADPSLGYIAKSPMRGFIARVLKLTLKRPMMKILFSLAHLSDPKRRK